MNINLIKHIAKLRLSSQIEGLKAKSVSCQLRIQYVKLPKRNYKYLQEIVNQVKVKRILLNMNILSMQAHIIISGLEDEKTEVTNG